MRDLGWHVIHGDDLLAALRRCRAGEDPDLVFAEMWANAAHEKPTSEPCPACQGRGGTINEMALYQRCAYCNATGRKP